VRHHLQLSNCIIIIDWTLHDHVVYVATLVTVFFLYIFFFVQQNHIFSIRDHMLLLYILYTVIYRNIRAEIGSCSTRLYIIINIIYIILLNLTVLLLIRFCIKVFGGAQRVILRLFRQQRIIWIISIKVQFWQIRVAREKLHKIKNSINCTSPR